MLPGAVRPLVTPLFMCKILAPLRVVRLLSAIECLLLFRRIFFLCVTVGEELLVGVVIGAVGVRVRVSRVRVRMIDSQPMPLQCFDTVGWVI